MASKGVNAFFESFKQAFVDGYEQRVIVTKSSDKITKLEFKCNFTKLCSQCTIQSNEDDDDFIGLGNKSKKVNRVKNNELVSPILPNQKKIFRRHIFPP